MLSIKAKAILNLYRRGEITLEKLSRAVSLGIIPDEEYEELMQEINKNGN